MYGEVHILTGMALCAANPDRWYLAIPLAIMSHFPLDDLNIGKVGRLYHQWGRGWRKALFVLSRLLIVIGIGYVGLQDWRILLCGLVAWLSFDWEWVLNITGRHGIGLHKNMWQPWMYREWGIVPAVVAAGLFIGLLI
jgi:hypothetical protein